MTLLSLFGQPDDRNKTDLQVRKVKNVVNSGDGRFATVDSPGTLLIPAAYRTRPPIPLMGNC